MKKEYLEIGEIVGTHGIRGDVKLNPLCDGPEFVKKFKTLYMDEKGMKPVKVENCRVHKNIALLKLEGVNTPEDGERLRGTVLRIKREDAHLPEGRYFVAELFGCRVVDAQDENICYGEMVDAAETGANAVWYIEKDGSEYLIPVIDDVVKSVDIEKGVIRISPLKGLFGDAD